MKKRLIRRRHRRKIREKSTKRSLLLLKAQALQLSRHVPGTVDISNHVNYVFQYCGHVCGGSCLPCQDIMSWYRRHISPAALDHLFTLIPEQCFIEDLCYEEKISSLSLRTESLSHSEVDAGTYHSCSAREQDSVGKSE